MEHEGIKLCFSTYGGPTNCFYFIFYFFDKCLLFYGLDALMLNTPLNHLFPKNHLFKNGFKEFSKNKSLFFFVGTKI